MIINKIVKSKRFIIICYLELILCELCCKDSISYRILHIFLLCKACKPNMLVYEINFVTFALGTAMVDKGNIHICLVSPKVNIMNAYNIRVESLRI